MKKVYSATMTFDALRGAGLKLVLIILCLLAALIICNSPVFASTQAEPVQQTTGTCVWAGRTYAAGQYFWNSSGQQYMCNADGSITYIGVTLGSPPVYPYPYVDPVPNAAISEVTCSYNGNSYYVGQYFWNQVGQQFVCNSDGSMSYIGVVGSQGYYGSGSPNLLVSSYNYAYPNTAATYTYTYPTYTYPQTTTGTYSYMPAGASVAYPGTTYPTYSYNPYYPSYYGYYYSTP